MGFVQPHAIDEQRAIHAARIAEEREAAKDEDDGE